MGSPKKRASGQGSARAKRVPLVPHSARVAHEAAPGLWIFEADDGQTYLAVKARPWQPWEHATYSGVIRDEYRNSD